MAKEYVVNKALCQCQFGTMPGFLKVTDNQSVYMNGKLTATDKTLGNTFEPPGFCQCNKSWPPKPCTPMITGWTGAYDGLSINGISSPLLSTSKGNCALGCPNCITFQNSGQVPIPNSKQVDEAAMALRTDLNPACMTDPYINDAYWIDDEGKECREFIVGKKVKLHVKIGNFKTGQSVDLVFQEKTDEGIYHATCTGEVNNQGIVCIENVCFKKKE